MKWLWKFWIKKRAIAHAGQAFERCTFHDDRQFPSLIVSEYCKSCDSKLCYMCSSPHYHHGCHLECDHPRHHSGHSSDSSHSKTLDLFNKGCKTSLAWPDLKCAACEKSWHEGPEPTICIACVNATCSAECHLALQDQQVCTFFKNFEPKLDVYEKVNGFRAIPKVNLKNVFVGQRVTFASPRFLTAFKEDEERISIERGFRQFGNPVKAMIEKMKVVNTETVYEHRTCPCDCELCVKSSHPVYNCLTWCLKSQAYREKFIECWCICSECIQKGAHTRKDCHFSCKVRKQEMIS